MHATPIHYQRGKHFYLAANLAPHNDKIRSYLRDMEPVIALKPDALIMSDPGLIMLTREHWPDQPIHLSVQANAVNWATVRFWQQQGISRVILSRELSLDEIEDIRHHVPDMELEVFVHGALCIAYSGRQDSQDGWWTVEVKNRFSVGDRLELMTPQGNTLFTLQQMRSAKGHNPVEVAPGSGHWVQIALPHPINTDLAMLIRHHDSDATNGPTLAKPATTIPIQDQSNPG